ncbi:MAG: flagellar FlbD family protein [Desulfobulbaceae bacterium]|jgi:flagellar protein FlbD|nr:flagellar FlbD family protein [Candidatus Kapabacteria bacterium]MBS3999829.1 flagellar FlbD family protein [Desulfobulbaceae bacterium]MCO5251344.1 flagellar FlbD family protein [Candidatus Kapabacteria bacterium]
MIELTKIDGEKILVNADEIETVESAFDTTITLKSGRKIIVKENKTLIAELVILYKRECNKGLFRDEQ